jgi:hypothetical protein
LFKLKSRFVTSFCKLKLELETPFDRNWMAHEHSQLVDENPHPPDMFRALYQPTMPQTTLRAPPSGPVVSGGCPQHCPPQCCSKRSLVSRINESNLPDPDKAFLGNLSSNVEQVRKLHMAVNEREHCPHMLMNVGECWPTKKEHDLIWVWLFCVVAHGGVSCGWEVLGPQTDDELPVPWQQF